MELCLLADFANYGNLVGQDLDVLLPRAEDLWLGDLLPAWTAMGAVFDGQASCAQFGNLSYLNGAIGAQEL